MSFDTLQNGNIREAAERITAYMEASGKSQTQAAKEIGISGTTLSLYLKGRYTGNSEDIAEMILKYLRIAQARASLSRRPDISPAVGNTQRILQNVYNTQLTGDILLIYGAAGCGKTTALQYYRDSHSNVIYIEADVTNSSCRAVLGMAAEELGEDADMPTAAVMRRLVAKLKGSTALLIIDEAQHLAPKAFDAIRALNDKTGIGIVYAGNPSIKKRMYGNRQEDYDQIYSRIGCHCPLYNRYSRRDIENIFSGQQLDQECISWLHQAAQRKGGMRVMAKQYCLASDIAHAFGEKISLSHLKEAAVNMGLEEMGGDEKRV